MRDGLRVLLHGMPEFKVVGDAFNAGAAWVAVKELNPDLVTLGLELPGNGSLALAHRLRRNLAEIKIVILAEHAETRFVNEALRAGVQGYILKMNTNVQLVATLRAVLAGQVYLGPEIATLVVGEYRRRIDATERKSERLSIREVEVLKRIANGQTTKEIAFALSVSPKAVDTHRLHLLTKLGVKSVAELTKYAVREGLTTL
jgi:DNA-binding NarL/FixJ family response regulator